jgi:hypothetical protein
MSPGAMFSAYAERMSPDNDAAAAEGSIGWPVNQTHHDPGWTGAYLCES